MSTYGYLHTARVVGQDEASGGWYVQSVALARDRKWGPIPSCVAGLQAGDKVVLAATGTTRDNLLILGALDPRHPDIGDIAGLQEALDNAATDADLAALAATVSAFETSVNTKNDEQDGRLASVEADNVSQWDELSLFSGVLGDAEDRLDAAEAVNTAQGSELAALQTWMNQAYDWDNYGDLLSPMHRREATNFMTMVTGSAYFTKMRAHTAVSLGRIRYAFNNTAVGGGSVTGGLYTSSTSTGPFTLVKSTAATPATAINLYSVAWSDASTVAITRGTWVMAALFCAAGYSQNPRLATQQNAASATQLLHPSGSSGVVVGMKSGLAGLPATISPNDGTWTPLNLNFWAALAT